MKDDIKKMKNSTKTLTPADKTSNMYRISKEQYNHLKDNAITSKYKKVNNKIKVKVDESGMKFAKKADVLSRMEKNGSNNCFVTLKDHKANFENHPTTRLINPAKNKI